MTTRGIAFWVILVAASLMGPPAVARAAAPFRSDKLAEMDAAIAAAVAAHSCPGGVLWFERGGVRYHKAYGKRALVPIEEGMTENTIFDAASLTKVVATTPAVMLLVERGRVSLDAPVARYLPEFTGDGREKVTVRHLLTHTSGLRPGISAGSAWSGYERGIELACAEKPTAPPGSAFRYSDVNFILLGEIVRRVSGKKLNEFAEREIYRPLKMVDTGFLPSRLKLSRIAPTEKETNVVLRGVVHDPTARRMGGVAGHAGLFTTAADLARYARMFLNRGQLDRTRLFRVETVRLMTSVQTPGGVQERRGLGWDIDSAYAGPRGRFFPIGSYGHTGWTGTSLWIDPFAEAFLVFLSNRNHPTEDGSVLALRNRLGTLAAEAVADYNYVYVPGALPRLEDAGGRSGAARAATVRNGVDTLVQRQYAPLRGLRVGLITNHTGHDRERSPTIDLLRQAPEVRLTALFSPEHGIRGEQDADVGDSVDQPTGLPVHSLYGKNRAPTPAQLKDLDALVFDVQDIGCRFYTYISTMGLCLEAAAKARIKFIVLDRVNPINGKAVEGPVHRGASTFVAFHSLPLRHGLTVGELARLLNSERGWKADLTVIPVQGWERGQWLDETGLPWTNPSPNMRNLTEATLYPGIGLLESAVSVGRGTDTPFEVVGAPYVRDVAFARELNQAGLPGIRFVPIRFTPRASTFQGQECGGVYLVVTDRDALAAVDVGIQIALALQRLYPQQFALDKTRHLLEHAPTLEAIRTGKSLREIKALWTEDLNAFRKRREGCLLYR